MNVYEVYGCHFTDFHSGGVQFRDIVMESASRAAATLHELRDQEELEYVTQELRERVDRRIPDDFWTD